MSMGSEGGSSDFMGEAGVGLEAFCFFEGRLLLVVGALVGVFSLTDGFLGDFAALGGRVTVTDCSGGVLLLAVLAFLPPPCENFPPLEHLAVWIGRLAVRGEIVVGLSGVPAVVLALCVTAGDSRLFSIVSLCFRFFFAGVVVKTAFAPVVLLCPD